MVMSRVHLCPSPVNPSRAVVYQEIPPVALLLLENYRTDFHKVSNI